MAVQAELVVHHHGCPTETFTGGTCMAQISGDRGSDLFVLHADDPEELDRALRVSEEAVGARAEVLERTATSIVFRGRNLPGGILSAIQDSGCSVLWPVVYRDGLEHYTLLSPDRPSLRHLVDQVRGHGDVQVRAVSSVEPQGLEAVSPIADLTSGLTRRQLDLLVTAVEAGYFQVPRRTSAEELAAADGTSVSTLTEHLRKAECALLERVATLVAHHPVLARAATKGPGRPPAEP